MDRGNGTLWEHLNPLQDRVIVQRWKIPAHAVNTILRWAFWLAEGAGSDRMYRGDEDWYEGLGKEQNVESRGRINELMREEMNREWQAEILTEKRGWETKSDGEGARRKCRRACFYGLSGKIWDEGVLHHHGGPMKRLGYNVQRECPSNSRVNTIAASVPS